MSLKDQGFLEWLSKVAGGCKAGQQPIDASRLLGHQSEICKLVEKSYKKELDVISKTF